MPHKFWEHLVEAMEDEIDDTEDECLDPLEESECSCAYRVPVGPKLATVPPPDLEGF